MERAVFGPSSDRHSLDRFDAFQLRRLDGDRAGMDGPSPRKIGLWPDHNRRHLDLGPDHLAPNFDFPRRARPVFKRGLDQASGGRLNRFSSPLPLNPTRCRLQDSHPAMQAVSAGALGTPRS